MKLRVLAVLALLAALLGVTACSGKAMPTASPTVVAAEPTKTATPSVIAAEPTPTSVPMPEAPSSDLEKLFTDVFAPQPGEKVLVVSDLPHGKWGDNAGWANRREMATE